MILKRGEIFYLCNTHFCNLCSINIWVIFLRAAPLPLVRFWNRSRLFVCLLFVRSTCPEPIIRPRKYRLAEPICWFWGSPFWINTVDVDLQSVVWTSSWNAIPWKVVRTRESGFEQNRPFRGHATANPWEPVRAIFWCGGMLTQTTLWSWSRVWTTHTTE